VKTLLLGVVAAFAVSSFAWADAPPTVKMPVKMTDQQLDQVVAGWVTNCRDKVCMIDGINPGTFKGRPAPKDNFGFDIAHNKKF
jgi:hypothetical protein